VPFTEEFSFFAILYIILYSIWFKQGYQEYSKVSGIIYVKVKGLGYLNDTVNGLQIFDNNDLVEPPTEPSALFVTAGLVRTLQQRDKCSSSIPCTTDTNCKLSLTTNGQLLDSCNTTSGYCIIQGWCPLENDTINNINVLSAVESITVFMRSSVKYDTFGVYEADPAVPIQDVNLFTLQQIIGSRNIKECAQYGCIVSGQVDWTCNMNIETCKPRITFIQVSGGFNFRTANYDLGHTARELSKLYGVRLLLQVTGTGGRFSIFQTVITIGAGAAFITLATVITDLLLLFFFSSEESFADKKYSHIDGSRKSDEELRSL